MTIPRLFLDAVEKFPDNPFLWEKNNGNYQSLTYKQTLEQVNFFACGLMHLGIERNDKVVLLSEGRQYWVIAELGILFLGAVCVPISVKIEEPEELKFRILHSESRFIIVSAKQLPKIIPIIDEIPSVQNIIVFDEPGFQHNKLISFKEVMETGEIKFPEYAEKLKKITLSILPDDYANICYTSGTTADPKGIILTHRNYTANVDQASSLFEVPEWYISLMILPWDHSFTHTVGIYTLMRNGASLAAVQSGKTQIETLRNVSQNIKEIRPVFLLSVPALAKNFKANIEKAIREKGYLTHLLFRMALRNAYFYNGLGFNKGKGFRKLAKPLHVLFDAILFKKIREGFGGRLRFFVGGGALLDIEFQKFFYAIGIPMYQGYGLTEASPVISSNTPERHKFGSSGIPVKNLELKICDEQGNTLPQGEKGEIVIRGENVMAGYWKNESATKETLKNGWLHTGDMGYMDKDGFLYVTGRFKSLLIGSDGEKYSPEAIEEAIVAHSPYIEQIMLYNNQNAYTVALIYPSKENISNYLKHHHHKPKPGTPEWSRAALELLQSEIARYLKHGKYHNMFPHRWIPASFAIITEPFSEQNKMINSTMKMVRGVITKNYQHLIDFMYTSEGKNIFNDKNLEAIKS